MIFIFPLIAITVLVLLYCYVGSRLFIKEKYPRAVKVLITVSIVILSLLPLASVITARRHTGPLTDMTAWIGYIGMGFFSIAIWLVLPVDLIRVLLLFTGKTVNRINKSFFRKIPRQPDVSNDRRNFLKTGARTGILGVSGALAGYGIVNAAMPRIKTVSIPLDTPVEKLLNLRIVQITDLHVGPTIKGDFVRNVVDQINRLDPDIIALTGDLADGGVSGLAKDVLPLKGLKSRYGNFFVTGNHEYYSGVDQWLHKIRELGFTTLLNEHRVIDHSGSRIVIGGVNDYSQRSGSHISDPRLSLSAAPDADLRLLLAHQPLSVYTASKAGYDVQLSGHTHGGQYFPWSELVVMSQPFLSGLYRHEKSWVYVSEGTGYWGPPLRIGTRPEITLIGFTA